jgi:nucleoside-diphosphate-sugar epimerase
VSAYGTLAITGGTGFLGGHLIRAARRRGFAVRALTRKLQAPQEGVVWIPGALDRPETLAELAAGADAVIHVAGAINAPDAAGFQAINVEGTLAMIQAARGAGIRRFIHVSSLAAREPELSNYGWSKARSETVVAASALDWTVVRPPAIYGEGDRETLELFRMARRGVMPLPPNGRLSLIEAGDLSRLLLLLLDHHDSLARTYEPDDGMPGGWDQRQFAHALGDAVGRKVRAVPVPAFALKLASAVEVRLKGGEAKLTADRVRYFCHPDWVARPEMHPPPTLWRPRIGTFGGLKATADWYREHGWLD